MAQILGMLQWQVDDMKILFITTFPFTGAKQGGGALRCLHDVSLYRSLGHEVQTIGSCWGSQPQPGYTVDVPYEFIRKYSDGWNYLEDAAIGEAFWREDELFEALADCVEMFPDIIQVEHPWMFRFAQRLVRERFQADIPIVYESHNIEYEMKDEMLRNFLHASGHESIIKRLKEVELAATRESAGVICVAPWDLEWTRRYTDRPTLLAPSAVEPWSSTVVERKKVADLTDGLAFALYCGSGHPPNAISFFEMLGGAFGSLDRNQRLLVAGSVCGLLEHDARFESTAVLKERTQLLGMVEQDFLAALLDMAHVIILPITQGGGMNLKTAEALWAGHHIVTTSKAMRGFESFLDAPGVYVEDTPGGFKRALRQAMSLPALVLDEDERERRRSVLWEKSLAEVPAFMEYVLQEARR